MIITKDMRERMGFALKVYPQDVLTEEVLLFLCGTGVKMIKFYG
jgi:hypothetical protein